MSDIVLKAENISKQYRLGVVGTGTLRDDFSRFWARVRGKEDPTLKLGATNDREKIEGQYVWALRDINFEVKRGEVLGIIGKNGAGKSTLLKILSRVTSPTTGSIKTRGRIASLLEVGTGFHPELTGRENIFLNGAILGMTRAEIKRKFDEIVDFSGIGKYIDTPVKRYSSGMYVRLAFAVAAHLDPEILIIDEVLAVGDAEFQKKCLGKMKDVSVNEGRTVLFVSHNMEAVNNLTQRSLFMKNGKIELIEKTSTVIDFYLAHSKSSSPVYSANASTDKPKITNIELQTSLPNNTQAVRAGISFTFKLHVPNGLKGISLSFQILDFKERNFVHSWVFDVDQEFGRQDGLYELRCRMDDLKLYMGRYFLKVYLSNSVDGTLYEVLENVCPFEVVMHNITRSVYAWQPETCAYMEDFSWEISKIN